MTDLMNKFNIFEKMHDGFREHNYSYNYSYSTGRRIFGHEPKIGDYEPLYEMEKKGKMPPFIEDEHEDDEGNVWTTKTHYIVSENGDMFGWLDGAWVKIGYVMRQRFS
jgi:hypothetical protein